MVWLPAKVLLLQQLLEDALTAFEEMIIHQQFGEASQKL